LRRLRIVFRSLDARVPFSDELIHRERGGHERFELLIAEMGLRLSPHRTRGRQRERQRHRQQQLLHRDSSPRQGMISPGKHKPTGRVPPGARCALAPMCHYVVCRSLRRMSGAQGAHGESGE
jgi:hypothetical protein